MTETREKYITAVTPPWELRPTPPPKRTRPDQVDILVMEIQTGILNLEAAADRMREIISAAEIASANAALESWVDDDADRRYERCTYCGSWDGACSH